MTKLSEQTIEERFGENPIAMTLIATIRPLVNKFNELNAQIEQIKMEHDLKKKEDDRDKVKDDEIKPLMAEFAEVTGEKTLYWPDGSKAAYTEPGKRRSYDWKKTDDVVTRLQMIKGNLRRLADVKPSDSTTNPFVEVKGAADIAALVSDIATGKEDKARLNEVAQYLALLTAERDALKAKAETVEALKLAVDTDAQAIEVCLEDLAAARSESDTSDRISVSGGK